MFDDGHGQNLPQRDAPGHEFVTGQGRRDAVASVRSVAVCGCGIIAVPGPILFANAADSVRLERIKDSIMHKKSLAVAVMLGALALNVGAWDYDGHRAINELALASLPADFGGFALTPAMKERVAFLGGEADRWRNVGDLPLKHVNGPDHFMDLEDLKWCGLTPETLPLIRYDFVAAIARERAAHPEKFPLIDPAKNADHTRELSGFLPWAITEYYVKLKSCFSYLKALQKYGTPEEIANAQANIVYVMGVMGHYVGDGAQPLHTTVHFNGWAGDNPKGYTTRTTFHAWKIGRAHV
jgi:hypothetical protein